jgi:acyl carrier protein
MSNLEKQIREFILAELQSKLQALDISVDSVGGDFDMVGLGVLDSISFIELVGAVEQNFQLEMDFEDWDPADFTVIDGFICCAVEGTKTI